MTDNSESPYRKPARRRKPFGIEEWNPTMNRWQRHLWYGTERARDDSLAAMKRRAQRRGDLTWNTRYRKIDRKTEPRRNHA